MKRLIIIRHAQYDDSGHVNPRGKYETRRLARNIKATIDDNIKSIILLTSPAIRAKETASIIREILEVEIEEYDVLLSQKGQPENLPKTLKLIQSKKVNDIVILVTHFEYVEQLPKYFSAEELNLYTDFPFLKNSEALDINCEEKSFIKHEC